MIGVEPHPPTDPHPLVKGVADFVRCRAPLVVVDGRGRPLSGVTRGDVELRDALAAHPEARGVAVVTGAHAGDFGFAAVDVGRVSLRHALHMGLALDGARYIERPDGVRFYPYAVVSDTPRWMAAPAPTTDDVQGAFRFLENGALVVLPPSTNEDGRLYRWRTVGTEGVAAFELRELRPLSPGQRGAFGGDGDAVLPRSYVHPVEVVCPLDVARRGG